MQPQANLEHPLMSSSSDAGPPSPVRASVSTGNIAHRLLSGWRRPASSTPGQLDHLAVRSDISADQQWVPEAQEHSPGVRDVPAILQDRLESITVLECRREAPTQLTLRCCSRQELLELVAPSQPPEGTASLLRLRDVRRLDPAISQHAPPSLMVRRGALLVSVTRLGTDARGIINAVLRHDRCFFLARGPDDSSVLAVHQQLMRLINSGGGGGGGSGSPGSGSGGGSASEVALPFEFLMLEAVLLHACDHLAETTSVLSRLVGAEVDQLTAARGDAWLRSQQATVLRHRLRELTARVSEELALSTALAGAISKPIEEDTLHEVCLTEAAAIHSAGGSGTSDGATRAAGDAEVLLETYLHEALHVASTLRALSRSLERAGAELAFQMDAARNRLLHFEVVATSVGTAMSVGAVISGILGMNLKTDLFNQDDWLFYATAIAIGVLCVLTGALMVWLQRGSGKVSTRVATTRATRGGDELVTLNRALSERPPTWQQGGQRDTRKTTMSGSIGGARGWD